GMVAAAGNLVSGNTNTGTVLAGTAAIGNVVQGNVVGTNATGSAALGNFSGIVLTAPNTMIGGTAAGAGNLVSGNTNDGLDLESSNNLLQGNLIGTNTAGTAAIGNGTGISVRGVSLNNQIGGTSAAARNVISGNRFVGLLLYNAVFDTSIQGNYIGTDVTGTLALANPQGIGD